MTTLPARAAGATRTAPTPEPPRPDDVDLRLGERPGPTARPWLGPESYWPALDAATAELDPPFATLDARALRHNVHDLLRRAGGTPVRVASKSVRVRGVLDAVLAVPGYAGVLAYTLPEALWLATDSPGRAGVNDVVVGYPSVHRAALAALTRDPALAARVTLMVDDVAQLDAVDAARPAGGGEPVRVCLELDASWDALAGVHVGVYRSPVHSPARAAALARQIAGRPGFTLVGVMAYEAQIAGLTNATGGRLRAAVVQRMQALSARELAERRGEAVAAVRAVADLEFVNGGGTGSLESTSADPSVTEVAAGSGLVGPHLFDGYTHFSPAPAEAFVLPFVRTPAPGVATLLGGGWVASGVPGADRLPRVEWPRGTRYVGSEGAGEVQTPLRGAARPDGGPVRPGDRAWLRHTKAGELAEHVTEVVVLDDHDDSTPTHGSPTGPRVVGALPTYRGEGKAFL